MISTIPTSSGIYRITCTPTGKFYIGSAVNLRARARHHRNELRRGTHRNQHLQHAWDKHTEQAFVFEILELVLILEMLTAREQYWFDTLQPFGERGFNLDRVAGSALGREHTQETRARISKSHIGIRPFFGKIHTPETRKKMSKSAIGRTMSAEGKDRLRIFHTGKKASPETREKMRNAHLGRKHSAESIHKMSEAWKQRSPVSEETREKIRQAKIGTTASPETRAKLSAAMTNRMKTFLIIAPDGTEHVVHGIEKFCREHALDPSSLWNAAKGKRRHHKGWTAKFLETG